MEIYVDYLLLFSFAFIILYLGEVFLYVKHVFSFVIFAIFSLYTIIIIKNKILYYNTDKEYPRPKVGELY